MKITNSTNYNLTSFKATKVATTQNLLHGVTTEIELYKLGREDKRFLQEWLKKVDFKKLCPDLSKTMQERWQKVFNYCIAQAEDIDHTSYVAVSENKPCGILTYVDGVKYFLDGICAVPNEFGKKANLVGKTLFYQIFKDAQENEAKGIDLKAINDGPFDVVDKYEKLGFKQEYCPSDEYTKMHCNKHKIATQLRELPFEIDYIETEPEKVNLNYFLD